MTEISPLAGIVIFSLLGGALSVLGAALVALNIKQKATPMLISYAIGAMLAAVFLEILPHAMTHVTDVQMITSTVLFGVLLFFTLEKIVLWRHCHGDHCEAHAPHTEENCPDTQHTNVKYQSALHPQLNISKKFQSQHHVHGGYDHGRSGAMIMIGDTFHNFVDGILIASAFMMDVKLGVVTAVAIIAHEIPQEIGDFLILIHSGFSKKQALWFNLGSSFATLLGGVLAYHSLQRLQYLVPYILALAAASMLYVAVADLIPSLHKRTELKATMIQLILIGLGVASVAFIGHFLG